MNDKGPPWRSEFLAAFPDTPAEQIPATAEEAAERLAYGPKAQVRSLLALASPLGPFRVDALGSGRVLATRAGESMSILFSFEEGFRYSPEAVVAKGRRTNWGGKYLAGEEESVLLDPETSLKVVVGAQGWDDDSPTAEVDEVIKVGHVAIANFSLGELRPLCSGGDLALVAELTFREYPGDYESRWLFWDGEEGKRFVLPRSFLE